VAWAQLIDDVVADLQAEVAGLDDVDVHRYQAWDPTELQPDGRRHLAVWPAGEAVDAAEESQFLGVGAALTQAVTVLVWEGDERAPRGVADEVGAAALLTVQEAVRDRLISNALAGAGGSWRCTYGGSEFPEAPGATRWVRVGGTFHRLAEVA
jgi:hypothetical protein